MSALDRAAADPESLDELGDDLPALQYALHAAAERALVPLVGGYESSYDELEYALSVARDETADVAETLVESGPAAAAALLWEWRVALFGVRLALQRLEHTATNGEPPPPPEPRVLPLVFLGAGVALVLGGALTSAWPLWFLGLVLVVGSAGLSRRP